MALLSPPRGPSDEPADLLLTDSELLREFRLLDSSLGVSPTNLLHLNESQFGHTMSLADVRWDVGSTLSPAVSAVISSSAEEPVCVVVAGREVAGVEYEEAIPDGSDPVLVSPSSGRNHFGASRRSVCPVPEQSVRTSSEASGPRPTFLWPASFDFGPIPLFYGQRSTHMDEYKPSLEEALRAAEMEPDDENWLM